MYCTSYSCMIHVSHQGILAGWLPQVSYAACTCICWPSACLVMDYIRRGGAGAGARSSEVAEVAAIAGGRRRVGQRQDWHEQQRREQHHGIHAAVCHAYVVYN